MARPWQRPLDSTARIWIRSAQRPSTRLLSTWQQPAPIRQRGSGIRPAQRPSTRLLSTLTRIFGLAYDPTGRRLATAGTDGRIVIHDLPDRETPRRDIRRRRNLWRCVQPGWQIHPFRRAETTISASRRWPWRILWRRHPGTSHVDGAPKNVRSTRSTWAGKFARPLPWSKR